MEYISIENEAVKIEEAQIGRDKGVVVAYGKHMASKKANKQKKVSEGKKSIRDRLK